MPAAGRRRGDRATGTDRAPEDALDEPRSGDHCDRERGSVIVDFVLIGGLLTLFFLAIIQLTLILHVRNTLIDAAASGARYGTLADRNSDDARDRTARLITTALNAEFSGDVTAGESTYHGLRTLEVTVRAPFPVIGLIGPAAVLEVKGHAAIQP
ncbi:MULTISPECIES: TadE/TadG family type IV pilus assembly protein [Arthrobacter]|uniref:Pilus assembly protein n=1 Tax=Arthrobacter oryzae TaxID=409290 RepID=A0A3N0C3C1_9MICC|nr:MULTISPECIES: TadE family protein [Arthrobacter]QYF89722.1 pilus assembly protein [Arthrobacter sp. PAMC25284]RNL57112.1 pilus assembly protein [Arthrobacter oryzae]